MKRTPLAVDVVSVRWHSRNEEDGKWVYCLSFTDQSTAFMTAAQIRTVFQAPGDADVVLAMFWVG